MDQHDPTWKEHINKNYDHIPTLQEIDSDPFFDDIKIYDDKHNIFQRIKYLWQQILYALLKNFLKKFCVQKLIGYNLTLRKFNNFLTTSLCWVVMQPIK